MTDTSRSQTARGKLYDRMREKVLQHCKDFFRPYHGSTRTREETDGLMMVENRDLSGGSWPLNAAVMELWGDDKLAESRRLFGRELYAMAMHPEMAAPFGEMHDLFGRYGAGDSDYDELREGAARDREAGESLLAKADALKGTKPKERPEDGMKAVMAPEKAARYSAGAPSTRGPASSVRRHLRLLLVDAGIDWITRSLIEKGVTDRDFWADFGLNAVPTQRTVTAQERYGKFYLYFAERCEEYAKSGTRYRNKALQATAEHFAVAKSTVQLAVEQHESGYLRVEAS